MDEAEGTRLTAHQRHWLEQIQACEASGKSVVAYASEHGFPVRAMYDAKKVLVRKGVLARTHYALGFSVFKQQAVTVGGDWRIQLPNGIAVDFSGTVDAGSLSTVLNTVARLEMMRPSNDLPAVYLSRDMW